MKVRCKSIHKIKCLIVFTCVGFCMNYNVKQDKGIISVLTFSTLAIIIIIVAVVFLIKQENNLGNNVLIENAVIQQKQISTIISMSDDMTDINELYNKLSNDWSSNSYWFIYSDDSVILEKNENETNKFKGMNLQNMQTYFESQSGDDLNEFFQNIKSGKKFSSLITKEKSSGSYLLSAQSMSIGDNQYCIGHAVKRSYIFSSTKLNEHILRMRLITGALCALLVVTVVTSSIIIVKRKNKIKQLEAECKTQNQKLQQIQERNPMFLDEQKDSLTGLYSRLFFDAIVSKFAERKVDNIRFVFIRIDNLDEISSFDGDSGADRLITTTANIIKDNFTEHVSARFSRYIFSIAVVGDSPEEMLDKTMQSLKKDCPDGKFSTVVSQTGNIDVTFWEALNRVYDVSKVTV